jgi:integrase
MSALLAGKRAGQERCPHRKPKVRHCLMITAHVKPLIAFCNWCVGHGYLTESPLRKLGTIDTTPQTERRALTAEEIARLFSVAPAWRRLVYAVALSTGLRLSELRRLDRNDLDAPNNRLCLQWRQTKNKKPAYCYLPVKLVTELAERIGQNVFLGAECATGVHLEPVASEQQERKLFSEHELSQNETEKGLYHDGTGPETSALCRARHAHSRPGSVRPCFSTCRRGHALRHRSERCHRCELRQGRR